MITTVPSCYRLRRSAYVVVVRGVSLTVSIVVINIRYIVSRGRYLLGLGVGVY